VRHVLWTRRRAEAAPINESASCATCLFIRPDFGRMTGHAEVGQLGANLTYNAQLISWRTSPRLGHKDRPPITRPRDLSALDRTVTRSVTADWANGVYGGTGGKSLPFQLGSPARDKVFFAASGRLRCPCRFSYLPIEFNLSLLWC